jgi:1-acyl-sn-glycerol-3-phosphate acyltransferase
MAQPATHSDRSAGGPGEEVDYGTLLAQGKQLYPEIRIGRPVRSRWYWATIAAVRALRVRYAVRMTGGDQVARGSTILIGNHVNAMDPVMVVIAAWWRCIAFTKVELYQRRGSFFFRFMGQIPLRRGNAESTAWAMQMAQQALAYGGKLALYPEGTRSPRADQLHKLHKRILIPVLQANPDTPVHAVGIRYAGSDRFGRRIVEVRVSEPLELDAGNREPDEIVADIRDRLLELSGQTYVDRYAQDIKAELRSARAEEET